MNTDIGRLVISVKDIMRGNKNIVLIHDNKRYALSITRRGKLILTADEVSPNAKIAIQ